MYELMRDRLTSAGIPATDDEIALVAAGYPAARTVVAGLYAVPTDDVAPATEFDPAPTEGDT
jgi:hypothetical protein